MSSPTRLYFDRTFQMLGKRISDKLLPVVLMKGAEPTLKPRTMFSFNTPDDIKTFATGCDADIGGLSTTNFDLDTRPEINRPLGKEATGRFYGRMSLGVKPGMEGKIRSGYAGFRNKRRPTMFGDVVEDASGYDYLALRLRAGGDPQTHSSYFVNIQTEGASKDLWQHRLYFGKQDGSWEDVYIPFTNFVRTSEGAMSQFQLTLAKEYIRSVGISLLTGNSSVEGEYELGIDSIRLVNEEDMAQDLDGALAEKKLDEKSS
ncbi:hypothetical protein D9619_004393 [Psilocybe cf. subviscida]|uniref:NADH:ubiquinone oxidoreductase intermediate-associated protein 30 domain-containing protein n=1 Tax=Psilocybe cf. subviscida TaxID=2480587 RepID=A0A8H5BQG6_9AGAR|nr:hypothetical protein D9619_004393 [Psilocybe cf. subviscida]